MSLRLLVLLLAALLLAGCTTPGAAPRDRDGTPLGTEFVDDTVTWTGNAYDPRPVPVEAPPVDPSDPRNTTPPETVPPPRPVVLVSVDRSITAGERLELADAVPLPQGLTRLRLEVHAALRVPAAEAVVYDEPYCLGSNHDRGFLLLRGEAGSGTVAVEREGPCGATLAVEELAEAEATGGTVAYRFMVDGVEGRLRVLLRAEP